MKHTYIPVSVIHQERMEIADRRALDASNRGDAAAVVKHLEEYRMEKMHYKLAKEVEIEAAWRMHGRATA